ARLSVAITTPTVGMVVFIPKTAIPVAERGTRFDIAGFGFIVTGVVILLLFSINVLYIGFKLTRGAAPLTTLIAA
ncbi:MAG: hypothetical protein ACO3GO_04395, partial [Terrimicrobiaceae bacterium]